MLSDGVPFALSAAWIAAQAACGPHVAGPPLAHLGDGRAPAAPTIEEADHARTCVVAGDGDPQSSRPFTVFAADDPSVAVAVVEDPRTVGLRFTSFPAEAERALAGVDLTDNGLVRMSGAIDLAERRFQLGARVDLQPPHVFAKVGTVVKVHGRRAGGLSLSIPTPFDDPAELRVVLPCRSVAYRAGSLALAAGGRALPRLLPKGPALTFFAGPAGRALFHAGVRDGKPELSLLERRGGWSHVLVGDAPETSFPGGTLIVDGWVRDDDVTVMTSPSDRDSHGGIPDQMDVCPDPPRLTEDTPLLLGSPNGRVVGVAEKGARVEVSRIAGGFAAITFVGGRIGPPPGNAFFVTARAVDERCGAATVDQDEGCPCTVTP